MPFHKTPFHRGVVRSAHSALYPSSCTAACEEKLATAELIQVGEFATEGERVAAETLRADLPSDWVIITNTLLPLRDGRTFEIDLLLLAQRHLFVLDEKAWGGTIDHRQHPYVAVCRWPK